MKYVELEKIDRKVSRLVYGTGVAKMTGEDEGVAFSCLDLAWEAETPGAAAYPFPLKMRT